MQETENLRQTIVKIGNEVKSLGVPDELFASKAFLGMYEAPEAHASAANALVGGRSLTDHQKTILAYSMQRLPAGQFAAFISSLADSVERGATGMGVLETAAFPAFNWGRQPLIVHYDDPKVRAVLDRLLNMKDFPVNRRTYIRYHVLSGEAKKEYLDYLDMIGRPAPK